MLRPEWDTQAQVTSALSVLRDQIPMTSSPRTLDTERAKQLIHHYCFQQMYWWYSMCVLTLRLSPCPCGPRNPINMRLLCDLLPRWHFVHESFVSTCGYLIQDNKELVIIQPDSTDRHVLSLQGWWACSLCLPGHRCCQRKSPSASQNWGCPCSCWCGSAVGQVSGRRNPLRSQWSPLPNNENLD